MPGFDIRTVNLRALNSMTKYPSIPTYHALDPSNGSLTDSVTEFSGTVIGTEKVDGTNSRIITLPDGSYLIGSREELLYARGDLIGNPALGIVDALREVAEQLRMPSGHAIHVHYLEVYGGKIGGQARQYSNGRDVAVRLFDIAVIDEHPEILGWPSERISGWREGGGQPYLPAIDLAHWAREDGLALVPHLFEMDAAELPVEVAKTHDWLAEHLPATRVAIAGAQPGRAEGIVLRAQDRSVIAKARFQDYERTLKRRGGRR
jgi:hypothetical protein